jgi:hypothetical protein
MRAIAFVLLIAGVSMLVQAAVQGCGRVVTLLLHFCHSFGRDPAEPAATVAPWTYSTD